MRGMLPKNLYAPRYWPEWLMVGFFAILVRVPWRLRLAVGRTIGRLARRFAGRRRHITAANLALCLPELDARERDALLEAHFESLGVGLIEMATAWWATDRNLPPGLVLNGLEHLERALTGGRGALLLTAHFTTLEMGARVLNLHRSVTAVYRPHENPVLDRVIRGGRLGRAGAMIERGDLRGMLRALRSGAVVWYAPDQAYLGPHGIEAPFFGIAAPTNTATARIAAASRAPVLPFFVRGLPHRDGYQVDIEAPLADFPSGDALADATRVNTVLEAGIRRAPSQYLWSHDRFKRFRRP
ncbi:MAG TPA: LpxL/LpxP family Kdo(2)-lipid IV(A) lauroyl/palmitoleoyl acyltransferase [Gammaproteobacteria bacterium]|nr:LpxL/LpxP family Kdo(2)-lipid IV(A) lauroyl/palmitoleoyl acyltransferase [Gammaproteobacteria bacterium]